MNTQTFTSLLATPQELDKETLSQLVSVIDTYPFFQSARALWLKGLKNEESFRYNDALKLTAAHTTNRDILFEFITSETFEQHKISRQILINDATIHDYDVAITEDVSQTIYQEQQQQTKEELQKAEAILNPNLFEKKEDVLKHMIATSNALTKETDKDEEQERLDIEKGTHAAKISEEKEKSPIEILEIGSPLEFSKKDTHSFSEWLQLTSATPIQRNTNDEILEEKLQTEKERKYQLIEKFINEKPKIKPPTDKTPQKNLAVDYSKSSESLMTETLAKVYLQQKNYKKAIQAYKILILKNPEKSGFFADQIRAVEKLINKEES